MESAFVGIDVAFAKRKRLPIVIARWRDGRLIPEPLRGLDVAPPRGHGNAATIDDSIVASFVEETVTYLQQVSRSLSLRIERIAIDSPSAPCRADRKRRAAEVAMDHAGIRCFATPTEIAWQGIRRKAREHLDCGGAHNRFPHANQLWMLVGFRLFEQLRDVAPCLEVFPQATARVVGAGSVHKLKAQGVEEQLRETARYTGWPTFDDRGPLFGEIAFCPAHDRLDAYLSAWVAALEPGERRAFGEPPDDVIWTPRVNDALLQSPEIARPCEHGMRPTRDDRALRGVHW